VLLVWVTIFTIQFTYVPLPGSALHYLRSKAPYGKTVARSRCVTHPRDPDKKPLNLTGRLLNSRWYVPFPRNYSPEYSFSPVPRSIPSCGGAALQLRCSAGMACCGAANYTGCNAGLQLRYSAAPTTSNRGSGLFPFPVPRPLLGFCGLGRAL
jgi:hypothetical protein